MAATKGAFTFIEQVKQAAAEKINRQQDALALYRPQENQLPFHQSMASERIIRGGNRAGKSIAAFAEFASAATGQPIIGPDGKALPFKFPKNRPLCMWVIGLGEKNITTPIYRLLFRPGAFRIIRDRQTGEYRAWNPNYADDADRREECEQSPPFIPKRMIAKGGWAWKNKAQRVFISCRLTTGTEIYAFTSNAEPKQGDPVDYIHIDEDIHFPGHVAEWEARLSDRAGRLTWAAFPHGTNSALVDMSRRAAKQSKLPNPDVFEVVLKFSDNQTIPKDEIRKRHEGWSEDEIRARDYGEFVTDTVSVYPNFSEQKHGIPEQPAPEDKLSLALRQNGLQPPREWTRVLVLDPGHTRAAVLFGAIPPPTVCRLPTCVIYDELALKRHDADALAEKVAQKAAGQNFETFIIDNRAGRQTPAGFGETVRQQYERAFLRYGLLCNRTDNRFIEGSDNLMAGVNTVRDWLLIRGDGTTRLRVITETCPQLCMEFRDYKKKMNGDEIKDEPVQRDCDLMDTLRYMAASDPQWIMPDNSKGTPSPAYKKFIELMGQKNQGQDNSIYMGAGAA